MARESTQQQLGRIRPPRVHITYDVETGGAIEMKELPFVMGVLGDFTGQPTAPLPRLKERKFVEVTPDNFDEVLASMKPHLAFTVENKLSEDPNAGKLGVDLHFKTMDDFARSRYLLEQRYQHVLVDEFQDTTYAQYSFLKSVFAREGTIVTVVGDRKQRIMGWAGALTDAFAEFDHDFDAEPFELTWNFRSTRELVELQHRFAEGEADVAAHRRNAHRGQEQAQQIRSRAERERTVIIAEAQRDSQVLRGEGDNQAFRIIAEATGRDADFYSFYRTLQAYRDSLRNEDTTMVLSPTGDFFKYFGTLSGMASAGGAGSAPSGVPGGAPGTTSGAGAVPSTPQAPPATQGAENVQPGKSAN